MGTDEYRFNEEYLEYLRSKAWKTLRKSVIERCNDCCERCGKRAVDEIHHLTYDRVYKETLDDLQGLCRDCHAFMHGETKIDPTVDSVSVKVTAKMATYFDWSSRKFRRFRHTGGHCAVCGQYVVPKHIFFGGDGTPNTDPRNWIDFKGSYLSGSGSKRKRSSELKAREETRKGRRDFENENYEQFPERYEEFADIEYSNREQLRETLTRSNRLVVHGEEWTIVRIRETETGGMVISLQLDRPKSTSRMTFPRADLKLINGELILDNKRNLWVYRDVRRSMTACAD